MKSYFIFIILLNSFSMVFADQNRSIQNEFKTQLELDANDKFKPFLTGAFGLQTTNMLIRDISNCRLGTRETKNHKVVNSYKLTIKVCYEFLLRLDKNLPGEFAAADSLDTFDENFDVESEGELENAELSCNQRREELIKMAIVEKQRLVDIEETDFLNRCFYPRNDH